jgi:hypothetical protein
LLNSIKNEAAYLESQLARFKENEDKLLNIMSIAYAKLETLVGGLKNDEEVRIINR